MIKDELTTAERHIGEVEAIRDFSRMKAERDSLFTENTELKDEVRRLKGQVSSAKKTQLELSKKEAEASNLTRKLKDTQEQLNALQDFKLKTTDGETTLRKMRRRFIGAQDREIEARVRARVEEETRKLQSQMPALVEKEFLKLCRKLCEFQNVQEAIPIHFQRPPYT